MNLVGWRTIIFNLLLVIVTAVLQWVVGFDWVSAVGEPFAVTIVAVANGLLRYITSTPVGQKSHVVGF